MDAYEVGVEVEVDWEAEEGVEWVEGKGVTRTTGRRRRRMKGAERVVNAVPPHVCGDIGRRFAARP